MIIYLNLLDTIHFSLNKDENFHRFALSVIKVELLERENFYTGYLLSKIKTVIIEREKEREKERERKREREREGERKRGREKEREREER